MNKDLKAEYFYLKGKALDYSSDSSTTIPTIKNPQMAICNKAEEYLSKASKLKPFWNEPLNALGHVYWKKRDFENSILCYKKSIEENPNDKIALRCLSMVIRMQDDIKAEDKPAIWKESIDLATKAVSVDLNDP